MKTISGLLAGLFFAASFLPSASALTVPVSQDTYTSTTGTNKVIYPASGNGASLPVSQKNSALIQFDLQNLDAVPPSITGSNITSAILQLYIISPRRRSRPQPNLRH